MDQEEVWRAAGQRIRDARVAAGVSQEELAMDAEWDQSTLSKVERQGPHIVSLRKLEALAEALGCVVDVTFRPRADAAPQGNPER